MRHIFVPMQPGNVDLILSGEKTTTTRTHASARKIGMQTKESCICHFKGYPFIITCLGHLKVDEAGGREQWWKSEGFHESGGPMFEVTDKWLNGKGKLWCYAIKRM